MEANKQTEALELYRLIAFNAFKFAANAYRMYPDNKHSFTDYWSDLGEKETEKLVAAQQFKPSLPVGEGGGYKVGARVKIISCTNGHEYKIGEIVTIVEIDEEDSFRCVNDKGSYWYICESEGELLPTPQPQEASKGMECEADHISINELLQEFTRRGFDTSNWDGDEGAEKAIVDGVCNSLEEGREKLFDTIAEQHIRIKELEKTTPVNNDAVETTPSIRSKEEILEDESLMLSIETGQHWYKHLIVSEKKVLNMIFKAMEEYAAQFHPKPISQPVEEVQPIPDWIINYDKAGHRSSAGKAIRFLMDRVSQLENNKAK